MEHEGSCTGDRLRRKPLQLSSARSLLVELSASIKADCVLKEISSVRSLKRTKYFIVEMRMAYHQQRLLALRWRGIDRALSAGEVVRLPFLCRFPSLSLSLRSCPTYRERDMYSSRVASGTEVIHRTQRDADTAHNSSVLAVTISCECQGVLSTAWSHRVVHRVSIVCYCLQPHHAPWLVYKVEPA